MVAPSRILLSQSLLDQLKRGEHECLLLVGSTHEGAAVLVDSLLYAKDAAQSSTDMLPPPLAVLAVYHKVLGSASRLAADVAAALGSTPVALSLQGSGDDASPVCASSSSSSTVDVLRQDGSQWLREAHRLMRCHMDVRLQVVLPEKPGPADLERGLAAAVRHALADIQAPDVVLVAEAGQGGKALLSRGANGLAGSVASRRGDGGGDGAVVHVQPWLDSSAVADGPTCSGPVLEYRPTSAAGSAAGSRTSQAVTDVVCALDVLCYVPKGLTEGGALYGLLLGGLQRQLQVVQRVLAKLGQVVPVRAHHFLPPGRQHYVTICYPVLLSDVELNDAKLLPMRQALHEALGLPPNRPLLRVPNAVDLAEQAAAAGGAGGGGGDDGGAGARLRDVHLGLAPPGIGGSTFLVQGSYDYHHYMQDRTNDNGWGCAYRSLQTLCSWFKAQKYTSKAIPSHREIQERLVKLGDKERSFIGSSQWIGAIELSYILDDYLGVTCKILTVNQGADVPSHARQLAAHFAQVGTPVMIGGGVLAYTLLGVQFNEQTGDAAFLILDPHYTGGEDLRKIQQGTWVGWKRAGDSAAAGGPLFVPDAFYNFLCPQRPNAI